MFLVLLLSVLFTTLRMIRPYLVAVAMGAILAQLVTPLYAKLKKRGLGPKVASLLATLAAVLIALLQTWPIVGQRSGIFPGS